jgi:hypothetical protein
MDIRFAARVLIWIPLPENPFWGSLLFRIPESQKQPESPAKIIKSYHPDDYLPGVVDNLRIFH